MPGGALELLDGHLRADLSKDELVPVLVLDVDEREAKEILATFDPLGDLAEVNDVLFASLLADLDADNPELEAMVNEASEFEEGAVELTTLNIKPPPKLAWALIAIPSTKFGDIAELIEQIVAIPRRRG